jgi:hypothetical protein
MSWCCFGSTTQAGEGVLELSSAPSALPPWLLVGPVVGTVTDTSARILVEAAQAMDLQVGAVGSHLLASTSQFGPARQNPSWPLF